MTREFLIEVLSKYVQEPAKKLKRAERGKPYLLSKEVSFSVSHTVGWSSVCVGHKEVQVGIDIELRRRETIRSWRALRQRFFSPREALHVHSRLEFLEMWVCKEALVKATGQGIARGWSQFELDRREGKLQVDCGEGQWSIGVFETADLIGAWACDRETVRDVQIRNWEP
eukprot:CAMPEP_0184689982 /NCGR_PEP_ID=MMETSP0312-20130426/30960_1 /TAXON_ID=31354 /ORGANISM="Compsopogon coeruleus, Strain SAG 36.94" /LENGTH=169 /DNA_ID=CAMNT_0027147395 /DNA_START=186 /DNA_END=695 /DNA_ORIENTATION=-